MEYLKANDIKDYVYWEAKQILENTTVAEDPIFLTAPLMLRPCTSEDLSRFLDGKSPAEITDVNNLDVIKKFEDKIDGLLCIDDPSATWIRGS